ncbi:hypothetical protein DV737_g146, partial [Chaetothyriales sp. CBS 132003]
MLVSLTVGKVDAGVAVLLTQDKRLIEFPSILLPPSITSGSIVDITVSQNHVAEQKAGASFDRLQSEIVDTYGLNSPATPELRLRNATQTSIVLEWDPIDLQTTTLRSLALYRNGQKAGNIPRPFDMHSTKISGLQLETEYTFYLVLRTSGGTYTSNVLTVKTHPMTDLTGITVTPGVLPPQLRESLETAVHRIGAKMTESIRIDTTHFVCTEGRGREWERANEMNIPVVRPEWIEGCEREGKLIGVRGYYLDANPKHRQIGSNPKLERVTSAGATGPPASSAPTSASVVDPRKNVSMISPASQAAMAASLSAPVEKTNGKEGQKQDGEEDDNEDDKEESELDGEPGPEVTRTPVSKGKARADAGEEMEDVAL